LRWAEAALCDFRDHGEHGRIEELERAFSDALTRIGATHEAMLSSASCGNQQKWREQLQAERESDPLLFYFWKARDAEIHNVVIKWDPNMAYFHSVVVDAEKLNGLLAIYKRMWSPLDPAGTDASLLLLKFLYGATSLTSAEFTEHVKKSPQNIQAHAEQFGLRVTFALRSLALMPFTLQWQGKKVHVPAPPGPAELAADQCLAKVVEIYKGKAAELRELLTA
jgi:hypothetical protein